MLKLHTASAAPSAPYGLTSTSKGTTWLQVSWSAPATLNGLISYYTVVLNSTSSSATLSSNATTLNATGLVPCTLYTSAVSATTGCGAGCTGPLSVAIYVSTVANSMRTLLFTVDRITVTNLKAVEYDYCVSNVLLRCRKNSFTCTVTVNVLHNSGRKKVRAIVRPVQVRVICAGAPWLDAMAHWLAHSAALSLSRQSGS